MAKLKERLYCLDAIRIFAIILLLFSHVSAFLGLPYGGFFGIKNFYYVSLGGVAVTIFLVLSGLVLGLNYPLISNNYFKFIYSRFKRIYPIYWLSLLFSILIAVDRSQWSGLSDFLFSISGFYAFFGFWGGPYLATSWFIGLIISLYFFYPFLSKLLRKAPINGIIILLIISVLIRYLLGKQTVLTGRPHDWFPLARLFEFGLGIFIAYSMPLHFWYKFKPNKIMKNIISKLSELSFPIFLIHYPLLSLMLDLIERGHSRNVAVFIYLAISLFFSHIIIKLSSTIFR